MPHRYSDHLGRSCYLVLFSNIKLCHLHKIRPTYLSCKTKSARTNRRGSKKSAQMNSSKTTSFLRGEFSSAGSLWNFFLSAIHRKHYLPGESSQSIYARYLTNVLSIQSPIFLSVPYRFIKLRFPGKIKVKWKSIHSRKSLCQNVKTPDHAVTILSNAPAQTVPSNLNTVFQEYKKGPF